MFLRIIILLLSTLNAGYMAFDGARALLLGDYLRPQSGEYAGQLGPWADVVTAIGINPMGMFMKGLFLMLGLFGLLSVFFFIQNSRRGWKWLMAFSTLTLWNLMFGTMSSTIVILLLIIYRKRQLSKTA